MTAVPSATVFCVKAAGREAAAVNRLAAEVRQHLTRAVQVICLTNDPTGIGPDVTCRRMPKMPLIGKEPDGWDRLAVFAPEIVASAPNDNALYLDLDARMVGALDAFFDVPGEFLMARSKHSLFQRANAAVFRFCPQRSSDVFVQFYLDHQSIRRRYRDCAKYLARYMNSFGALGFWPRGWCADFVTDCIPPWPWRRWREPAIPCGSRLVTFNRGMTPFQASQGGISARGKFLPAPWINETGGKQ